MWEKHWIIMEPFMNIFPIVPLYDKANEPVFIVGVTRSGTALIKQILDRHPNLSVCHESYFLRKAFTRTQHDVHKPEQVSNTINQVTNLELHDLQSEEIEARFIKTGRSLRSLFDTILRVKMEKK